MSVLSERMAEVMTGLVDDAACKAIDQHGQTISDFFAGLRGVGDCVTTEEEGCRGNGGGGSLRLRRCTAKCAKPKKRKGGGGKGGPKKIDHKRRQERNGEIGRLGEEFALVYERWRLAGMESPPEPSPGSSGRSPPRARRC